jgi:hypothetical protein
LNRRFGRRFQALAAALILGSMATTQALSADDPRTLLFDIDGLGPDGLAALKADPAVQWWIEVGDRLLARTEGATMAAHPRRLGDLGRIDLEELWILQRGCQHDAATQPLLPVFVEIAGSGRHAVLRGPRRFSSIDTGFGDTLRPAQPNQTVASLWWNHHRFELDKAVAPGVAAVVRALRPKRWLATATQLASWNRSSFGTEIDLARDYIAGRYAALNLPVMLQTHAFSSNNSVVSTENVVATLTGTTWPDEWIVVGGHYDSRQQVFTSASGTPGAEDNASGCAGVIETAEVLSRFRLQRSVVFACYSGEEQGLYGSAAHVNSLIDTDALPRVRLMLNMDMIGFNGDAPLDVLIESRPAHQAVFRNFAMSAAVFAPDLVVLTDTSPCCSDHMPYLNAGVPAFLTIQNDWNQYAHYHRTTDLPQHLSLDMGGGILRMNLAVLATQAGVDVPATASTTNGSTR